METQRDSPKTAYNSSMQTARIVLACLLIIPLGLGVNAIVNPGSYWPDDSSTGEMLLLIFGPGLRQKSLKDYYS